MQSCDVVGGNVAKIAAMFPQCVNERKNTFIPFTTIAMN